MTSSKKQSHSSKNNLPINNKYRSEIIKILEDNLSKIVNIRDATFKEDTKQATDMKIEVSGTDIAVRQRVKDKYTFVKVYKTTEGRPDITIRSYAHNHKTEFDKIKNGYGDYYLYAWTKMKDWILYDIDKLRANNLLNKNELNEIDNYDGTKFVIIPIEKLYNINAIINCSQNVNIYIDHDLK